MLKLYYLIKNSYIYTMNNFVQGLDPYKTMGIGLERPLAIGDEFKLKQPSGIIWADGQWIVYNEEIHFATMFTGDALTNLSWIFVLDKLPQKHDLNFTMECSQKVYGNTFSEEDIRKYFIRL
jgi:hypothetical protein